MRRLFGSAAWAAAAVSTAVACSFSTGTSVSVDKKDLAKEISAQLEKQVGTLKDAGETYGVNVNVTKVDGTDVKFDLKINDQPQ